METVPNSNYELIKLIITIITAIITLIAIIKGYLEYQKSVKQKRVELFIKYRDHLKNDVIFKKILELLETNNNDEIRNLPRFDRYLFLGFYEEIALLVNSRIMKPEIAHYMFAYYAKLCWENDTFWYDISRESFYWRVFREFVEQMIQLETNNMTIELNQKMKFQI
jgi:hypothetical protein